MTTLRRGVCIGLIASSGVWVAFGQEAPRPAAPARSTGVYMLGSVTRVKRGAAEFRLSRRDGVTVGARLLVVRPSAGSEVVDEIEVSIVDEVQAVGRSAHGAIQVDDAVVLQRTLDPGAKPAASPRAGGLNGVFAEVTFWNRPDGETRTRFNARIRNISWAGLIDIRDVEMEVFMDRTRRASMTAPATSIKQLRVNGAVFVVDAPKPTLVTVAVHDYRQLLRAEAAERERIRLAEIAADERVRVAEAQAKASADERARVELARIAADERKELARIQLENARLVAEGKAEERRQAEAALQLAREERERDRRDALARAQAGGQTQSTGYSSTFAPPDRGSGGTDAFDRWKKLIQAARGVSSVCSGLRGLNDATTTGEAVTSGIDLAAGATDVIDALRGL